MYQFKSLMNQRQITGKHFSWGGGRVKVSTDFQVVLITSFVFFSKIEENVYKSSVEVKGKG